jgi:hypothetical protein
VKRLLISTMIGLGAGVLFSGCAWGEIQGVDHPDPEIPTLHVAALAKGLAHVPDKCHVVVRVGGFQGVANVPITGSSDPETCQVVVQDWRRLNPPISAATMEVWFTYPSPQHPIDRERFPTPSTLTQDLIEASMQHDRSVRRTRRPRSEGRAPRKRRGGDGGGGEDGPPRGWGRPTTDLSGDLDAPSERDLAAALVVHLGAKEGPRYFKVSSPPTGLVKLVIDVKSGADPSNVNEATWFRVSLLDDAGMALPHEEQEFVGVGQNKRHVAKWRFDGSPVIFKLATGSKAGDWMRIRFERVSE